MQHNATTHCLEDAVIQSHADRPDVDRPTSDEFRSHYTSTALRVLYSDDSSVFDEESSVPMRSA